MTGRFAPFLAFLIGCLFVFSPVVQAKDASDWSNTSPAINLTHIFIGEINDRGKASGFHFRPKEQDLGNTRIKKILSGPNKSGVYTAIVEILDRNSGKWREKFSSIFPDRLKKTALIKAILSAYRQNGLTGSRKWRGPSGFGFLIEGYILKDGRIITAYPIYKRDE